MRLFRICPKARLEDYSGLGASYRDGGRWNKPGFPALYFGTSASVAMLEMANYFATPRLVPASYRLAVYQLPDSVPTITLPATEIPSDWRAFPYPASTQAIGSDWLQSNQGVLLFVPSTTVPGGMENIALYNPVHPAAETIKLVAAEPLVYSPRMFSGKSAR